MTVRKLAVIVATAFAASSATSVALAQDKDASKGAPKKAAAKGAARGSASKMSFFITSVGSGKGADLGGLKGADAHCQGLAKAVGAGNRTWHAYLSGEENGKPVNARDRIGKGPWYNAKGELIAKSVDDLHDNNGANLNKQTALNEKGEVVNGGGDKPNMHDMLTGSDSQGRAIAGSQDNTCGNWTKSGEGSAMLGHHDRRGINDKAYMKSWNMAHSSIGCSQPALVKTGGAGLYYCFAAR